MYSLVPSVSFVACFTFPGAIDAVLVASRVIFGMEAPQISLLFWLMYVSAADGILKLCEAKEFTAQESTIKVMPKCNTK